MSGSRENLQEDQQTSTHYSWILKILSKKSKRLHTSVAIGAILIFRAVKTSNDSNFNPALTINEWQTPGKVLPNLAKAGLDSS